MGRRNRHSRAEFMHMMLWMVFSHLIFDISGANNRHGWLMFKETGAGDKTFYQWQCEFCSDFDDLDHYAWDIEHLIGNTTLFRSPLIDYWTSMAMQKISFVLFNADGEELDRFDFNLTDKGTTMDTFVDYLVDFPNATVLDELEYGLSLSIQNATFNDQFLLNILAINDNGTTGDKFILGTDYSGLGFMNLPAAVYEGCYEASSLVADTEVGNVLDCVHYCLGNEGNYIGLHSETSATKNSSHCRCLLVAPKYSSQTCSHQCTDGTRDCGELIDINSQAIEVGLAVYSISTVRDYLRTVSDLTQLSGWEDYTFRPEFDTIYSVNIGHVRFIREIVLLDTTHQNFSLAVTTRDCTANSFVTTMYILLGESTSNIKVFKSNDHIILEPVPAMCLFINFTDTPIYRTYILQLKFITGNFVMAHYFGVWGEWLNRECSYVETMQNSSIIPDSNINLEYTQYTHPISTGLEINMTESLTAKVDALLPVGGTVDYWIQNIIIRTSHPVDIYCKVTTNTSCTDQNSGIQVPVSNNASFDITAMDNSPGDLTLSTKTVMFCGQNIHLKIRTPDTYMTDRNHQFAVTVELYGCILSKGWSSEVKQINHEGRSLSSLIYCARTSGKRGHSKRRNECYFDSNITNRDLQIVNVFSVNKETNAWNYFPSGKAYLVGDTSADTCNHQNLFAVSGLAKYVKSSLKPIPSIAYPGLRLEGNGLLIFASLEPYISIRLSTKHDTMLQSVTVQGDGNLYSAEFMFGEKHATVMKDHTNSLVFQEGTLTGRLLEITNFVADDMFTPFLAVVKIVMCTNYHGYFLKNKTTHTSTTTTPTSTITTLATSFSTNMPASTTTPLTFTLSVQTTMTASTSVQTLTTGSTTLSNPVPPNLGSNAISLNTCCCGNIRNYTMEELDIIVREITKNLTIPRKDTTAYKRTLISADDARPSATYVGSTCGAVVVSFSGVFLVFMDLNYVMTAFNNLKSAFGFFR